MNVLGMVLAILFFAAGVAGTVLPALPGAPLIFLGIIIYGLFTSFFNLSLWFFIFQAAAVALIFLSILPLTPGGSTDTADPEPLFGAA